MKLKIFFSTVFFICSISLFAQLENDKVLFTVDDEEVYANEFIRVYNKNLNLVQDESQKDVDEYLNLYTIYKLKLHEARDLGFDKKETYLKEFNRYKKQLSNNYLTDNTVTEQLVKEAYERTLHEVNVDHILVKLDASATDTLQAYNTVLKYRDLLKSEKDFSKIKAKVHNGKTLYAEPLGYFSAFKVVYPFESVAYKTPVGEVSMPFRTQFGYHILRVNDKRKSQGEVTVAHIMVSFKQKDASIKPSERIQEIYKLYQQGENFEALAKQYSNDPSTANKGGQLAPFKAGQLGSAEFEEKAFSLQSPGDVTKPFKTAFGWHIVKLIGKKPIQSFEDLKSSLEVQVKRDTRSKLIDETFINDLKKRYNVPKSFDLSYFEGILNENIYKNEWSVPVDLPQDKILVDFGDKQITYSDFALYIESNQKLISQPEDNKAIIDKLFKNFLRQKLIAYHEDNLEHVNPEYAAILTEYRDGLLLFDVMQEKIWNAVKNDTIGLKNYYNANTSKYMWPERIDVEIISGTNKDDIQKARQLFKEGKVAKDIKAEINASNTQNIMTTSGVFTRDYQAIPKDFEFTLGVSKIYEHNNAFHVLNVREIKPKTIKEFSEAKGKVISDYQEIVEQNWVENLKKTYPVKVNKKTLKKVKKVLSRK